MSACSQERRKLGLVYPRTCWRCGLGPCSVFPPAPPGPPPNQGSGGSRPFPPMNEDIKRLVEALTEPLARWAEADAARCAAVHAYNARLAVVNAQRARGDWSERTDPEYHVMQETAATTRDAIQALSEARQALASLTTKETDHG